MLIALTGGFGTGKSTVLQMFESLGARVLSADSIVHSLLKKEHIKEKIRGIFGEAVFIKEEINRNALAEVVFNSVEKRKKLEAVLHPEVFREIEGFKRATEGGLGIVEIPLLFETGKEGEFDRVIVVVAKDEVVRKRLSERGFTEEEIEKRQRAQMSLKEKAERADFIIDNSLGLEHTKRQVKEIMERLHEIKA